MKGAQCVSTYRHALLFAYKDARYEKYVTQPQTVYALTLAQT